MVEERNPEREAYVEEVIAGIREQLRELKIRGEVTGRPEALLLDLREDGAARQGVRRDPRPRRGAGDRVLGPRLLRRARSDPRDLASGPRALQGLHRDAQGEPLPVAAHLGDGPRGRPLEIQIRTRAMHQTAEFGVAAHWKYKDTNRGSTSDATDELPWIEQLLEWQQEVDEPGDYLESLKIDLYQDEVFVFTPDGDVMGLPANATPIDFAYAVHTEVGHRCIGARVNGRLVPLEHELVNGDTVEVLTSKAEDAGTVAGLAADRHLDAGEVEDPGYFNRERREDAIGRGRDAITRALRRKGIGYARAMATGTLTDIAHSLSYKNADALFRAVGEGHVAAGSVAQQVVGELTETEPEPEAQASRGRPRSRSCRARPTTSGSRATAA
jgi:GTP diphosphokinase / guanosine-3',5'-bis(diphosphate) 3'-diphosphatase